ncbi:MAG: permease [Elusimicrobia bacterium]|nr:permease [Elusimicrobiota bacterium]
MAEEVCVVQSRPFYKNKLFLTVVSVSVLFLSSFFFSGLEMFRHHFLEYLGMVWKALLLGFLIGGLIEVYIPRAYIVKLLASKGSRSVLNATLLGFIFSGCSHGCLAITFELYKKGASIPAVIAFLLASPWANLSITLLLLSLFAWKGFAILISALAISLGAGFLYAFLDKKGWIEKNPNTVPEEESFSILKDIRERRRLYRFSVRELLGTDMPQVLKGSWHLAEMVIGWVLIGVTAASLIGSFLSPATFENWMGRNIQGLIVTLGLATVVEVCSEGSAPLAFEIYRQTGAFGNAFVFLMAGVVTDYTEIGLLWSNVGRRTALWLPLLSVPMTLLIGFLMNKLF